MALTCGTRLGPYEVIAQIGAGGMGEVYRAADTDLKRAVAIKVLPDAFATNAERLARFQREAEVLASLNHPNIGAIYGLERSDGTTALVMELIEGETLARRIQRGPVPVAVALSIAQEIAEALEAAHEKTIVHRDLKPANVILTPAGTVKVLDFGLAKVVSSETARDLVHASTVTLSGTREGRVVGTAAYMSPEQVRGLAVDKRTDIWAFGCVLYELLTGHAAFAGHTLSDTIAAILEREPDSTQLPAATPPNISLLLRRCLAKDARQRLHDIADARLEIETALSAPAPSAATHSALKRSRLALSLLAAPLVAFAFVAGRLMNAPTSDERMVWSSILPPGGYFKQYSPNPSLSADGRMVAFKAPDGTGRNVIWIRSLDSPNARSLPGTEESIDPFWSPDGHSLGFFSNGHLKRVDIAGGTPQILANAPDSRGGTWSSDGTILFVLYGKTVHRIAAAAAGGPSAEVTRLDAARHELIHGWPSFLPDNKHFLLWVFSSRKEDEGVYVGTLDTGKLSPLLPLRTRAQYANGFLFFGRQGSLMAQRFDPGALQLSGQATRVAEGLGLASGAALANAAFSVSSSGEIAWWGGGASRKSQPTWLDRSGTSAVVIGEPDLYHGLMPSPDGRYAATERIDLQTLTGDIHLLDLAGGNPSRLSFVHYFAGNPVWSPDSRRVLFTQYRNHLDVVSLEGGTEQIPFPEGGSSDYPLSWSPDGEKLLLMRVTSETRLGLWIRDMTGDRKLRPYVDTSVSEANGRISPDGRWVAYMANESGRYEVFVQSFPMPGNKKRISTSGGGGPMWRSDGRELYFVAGDETLMAVSVSPHGTSVEFSPPKRLFKTPTLSVDGGRAGYAPSADGKRFLFLIPVESDWPSGIHVIHNWKPGS